MFYKHMIGHPFSCQGCEHMEVHIETHFLVILKNAQLPQKIVGNFKPMEKKVGKSV